MLQRWPWIQGAGVESGRILRISFRPGTAVKNCEKPDPDPGSLFNLGSDRSLLGHFLSKMMSKFSVESMVAGV